MNTTPTLEQPTLAKPVQARPIDTLQIPFPKTIEELTALDAAREIPILKALCNRRGIHLPSEKPTPDQILPIVQQRLATHRSRPIIELPGGDPEWREINTDLQLFIRQLQTLIDSQKRIANTPTVPSPIQPAEHPVTAGDTKAVQTPQNPSAPTPQALSENAAETDVIASKNRAEKTLLDRVEELLAAEHPNPKKRKSKKKQSSRACHSSDPSHTSPPSHGPHPSQPSHSSHQSPPSHSSRSANASTTPTPPPPPDIIELSPGDLEIVIDLHNASPIDRLPPERQQKLRDLLATYPYRAVLRVISLPAPHGWGLQTSLGSLQRFRERHEKRQTHQQLTEAAQLARELLANKDTTEADLLAASTRLAQIRLLQTANDPKASVRDLKDLFQIQIRLKNLEIAQQRLTLQKETKQPALCQPG